MYASPLNLKEMFEPDKRFLVPMFQRPYVWTEKEQWRPLWEDVRDVAERLERNDEEKVQPHFLGAIVLEQLSAPISRVEARWVVDGQQRLTTLQLLLEAATDVCRSRGWDKYEKAFVKLTRNDNPLSDNQAEDRFKVWPTNVDREVFSVVMEAESADEVKKRLNGGQRASAIAQAYVFFSGAIGEWLDEAEGVAERRIHHLFLALREKLRVVVIEVGSEDDSQLIFETLNARGTPLLPADLIKNYLFHAARRENAPIDVLHARHWRHFETDAAYWRAEIGVGRATRARIDLFLQHYLTMAAGQEVLVAHLYSGFRRYVQSRPIDAELENLATFSRVFRAFDDQDRRTRTGAFLSRLEDLEVTTAHPLLLHLFHLDIDPLEREDAVVAIESFLVRRLVCHLTTKGYNRVFLDVLNAVRDVRSGIAQAVRQALLAGSGDSIRWPSDREFLDAWLHMPIYRTVARRRTRMILEGLEVASRGPKTEWTGLERKLTIEHVLPQSWQSHWPLPAGADAAEARQQRDGLVHTLGNLTLLTAALNPDVSNGPWAVKRRKIHDHGVLLLNKDISDRETWDEAVIRSRGEALFSVALKLWPRPAHPSDETTAVPSYDVAARKVLVAAGAETIGERVACPISGCPRVFSNGVNGWDSHIGSLRQHPQWHPEVSDHGQRKALFLKEYPDFPAGAAEYGTDRGYWEARAEPDSLAVYDAIEGLVRSAEITARVSYARHYIAIGGPKQNFCWLRPKKSASYCTLHVRVEGSERERLLAQLSAAGLRFSPNEKAWPRIELRAGDVLRHRGLLKEILADAHRRWNR